jgi:hypothetical protein
VFINGERLYFDIDPILKEGRTIVQARKIFESIGAGIAWDSNNGYAVATAADKTIYIAPDKYALNINGEEIPIDAPPVISGGFTMVPLRAVSEALGCEVIWNEGENAVYILINNANHE